MALLLLPALLPVSIIGAQSSQEPRNAPPGQRKDLLLLFSYDPLDSWSNSILQGLMETIGAREDVFIHAEYMDTRFHSSESYLSHFRHIILEKYGSRDLSLVMVCDDAALNFLLETKELLDPALPLLFCGINNVDPAVIEDHTNITGVNEAVDIDGTVNLGLSLFPETRTLVAVSSSHGVGAINLNELYRQQKNFNTPLQIISYIDTPAGDLEKELPLLPGDSLVLRLDNITNSEGRTLPLQESISFLSGTSPRPVLTCWDFDMGHGALGGKVVSAYHQGLEMGKMADQVLSGTSIDAIPILMESPNVPMFDSKQLQRFRIKENSLPLNAEIVNAPFSPLQTYRFEILIAAFLVLILLVLVLILAVALAGRRKAERALRSSEERFRLAMEASSDGLWDWDLLHDRVYWSPRAFTMLGYQPEQFAVSYAVWEDLIHPEDREKTVSLVNHAISEGDGQFSTEFRLRNRMGEYQWLAGRGKVAHKDQSGKVVRMLGTHVDISHLKRVEEELRTSLNEKEVLLRELYHRTKNNMQVIASLLSLRRSSLPDSEAKGLLQDLESKIYTMSLVHQMLYRSKNLYRLELKEYIESLCHLTMETFTEKAKGVQVLYHLQPREAEIELAIPLGLVVNELMTNALKYAFPPGSGTSLDPKTIAVTLDEVGSITIADNGIGIDASVSLEEPVSLGLATVKELVEGQLNGRMERLKGKGTIWKISF
jgi:PAS domain S-box-containing protein